ncbi:hypothetical protein [Phyllobacterium sp. SB3]|uniref:hypothetical protein n=1 Tax=Phyllobacterium sp. SB3 TaxID=3156073 RepID=UPI0032AEE179
MTEGNHDNFKVREAAAWYAINPIDNRQPAIPLLRERFGLTALEACDAVKEAHIIRARSL